MLSRPPGGWTGWGSVVLVGLIALGCQHGKSSPDTTAALTPESQVPDSPLASAASPATTADLTEALWLYDLHADLPTMTATLTPAESRAAQAMGDLFDLDIKPFATASTLRIVAFTIDGAGDLVFTFENAHPFRAPNFAAPANAQNRADLGYTGRFVIIANDPGTSYFGSEARIDTSLVKNPDGYVQPGSLLLGISSVNNTHPYVLLCDELQNNRVGVSNFGNMRGNYDPGAHGWNRSNAGAAGDKWTGYDFVHQGQRVRNAFTINSLAVEGSTLDLQVAALIKYSDPRATRFDKFPATNTTTSPPPFAYRLPHAALDCSVVTPTTLPLVGEGVGNTGTIEFEVRDWDKAAATTTAQLRTHGVINEVGSSAAGAPAATVACPDLSSATFSIAVSSGAPNGLPGTEVPYSGTLTNALGTAAQGSYTGIIRVVDPEDNYSGGQYGVYGVDPVTIIANPATKVRLRTYQAFTYSVGPPQPPTITDVQPDGNVGESGDTISFSATAIGGVTSWSWDFGAGALPTTSTAASPSETLQAPGTYNGTVTATNANGSSAPFPFSYTVTPPTNPNFGLKIIIIKNGASYPTLWGGLSAWTLAGLQAYFTSQIDPIYTSAGVDVNTGAISIQEMNDPALYDINSIAEEDALWSVLWANQDLNKITLGVVNNITYGGGNTAGVMVDFCPGPPDNLQRVCYTRSIDGVNERVVIAHELGHIMNLPHIRTAFPPITGANFNLMSYGTTSTALSSSITREDPPSCAHNTANPIDQNSTILNWVTTYLP